ncbi:MAG: hypothetical protein U5M53_11235 [Rhodoferax sp.]|nr:hypothetical protein [Rhodoferax sp.]
MLLSNLNLLATAPDGVAKLRELILTLAVQGKLVPQDPSDEPASVLLKKIRAEKDRLMAEGKIKRDKPLAEIAEEEKPFELPVGWQWVRFDELIHPLKRLADTGIAGSRSDTYNREAICTILDLALNAQSTKIEGSIGSDRMRCFSGLALEDGRKPYRMAALLAAQALPGCCALAVLGSATMAHVICRNAPLQCACTTSTAALQTQSCR